MAQVAMPDVWAKYHVARAGQAVLDRCQAPDVLKHVSTSSQGGVRMALRVVWPTWTAASNELAKLGASGRGGCSRSYSCFECRLVDMRGDSCIFIVCVDGDDTTKAVKDRGEKLVAQFFHGSAWVVSELSGLTALQSTLSSGCRVRLALVWHADAMEAPAKFEAVRPRSLLDRMLPKVPVAVLGQPLFFTSHLVDVRSSCQARIVEETPLRLWNADTAESSKGLLDRSAMPRHGVVGVRVRSEVRDGVNYLIRGDVVSGLAAWMPCPFPCLSAHNVVPARVADVVPCRLGCLAVQLNNAAGGHTVPVACAVVAVRGTCRARPCLHGVAVAVRCDGIADALPGPVLPRPVDLFVAVPSSLKHYSVRADLGLNKGEVALVVVNEALVDEQGHVCELLATHVWKLSGGHEGKRELDAFAEEVRAAHAPAPWVVAGFRKRPASACMGDEPRTLRCSPGVPIGRAFAAKNVACNCLR
jgi:hypothetical protein